MQLTEEGKTIISSVWKYALCIIASLVLFQYCHSCKDIPQTNRVSLERKFDSLNSIVSIQKFQVNQLKNKLLVLDTVKQKVIIKYVEVRKMVLKTLTDTNTVLQFVNICDSVIHVDSTQINTLNKVVSKQNDIITNQNSMINIDSALIKSYAVDLKLANKEIKKQKRLKVVAVIGGIVAVIATVLVR
jgi:hypothetical protein